MKFSLYSKKNVLDEMQEQTLRKIEGRGFWLMWGGLLAAWIVQTMFGAADKAAGEWVVFMIGCIYMCVACLRNGLWDRHLFQRFRFLLWKNKGLSPLRMYNIIPHPSGCPDACAVCVSVRRTAAAMQNTGYR